MMSDITVLSEIVKHLIKYIQNKYGYSGLYLAIMHSDLEIIKLLVNNYNFFYYL
jgi:hypothetical protein